MSNFFSLINNKFDNKISILDRGFSYGDGFFETMLWCHLGGKVRPIIKVEYWKRHYNRIKEGCDLTYQSTRKATTKNFRKIVLLTNARGCSKINNYQRSRW